MATPKVSVYITNYNYSRYLRRAIESVLTQSLRNFELFVIDDGSTDDSRAVMESYAGREGVELVYQQNRGLNVTNNIALRLARGEYIVRLDADDFFEPDALETMTRILDADPQVGLVFPDYYVVDRDERKVEHVNRLDFSKEVHLLDQPAHGACTMIRRQHLLDLGGYDESYRCQDGYELWIKFIARHKVVNVNRPLFHYRQHGENLTGSELRILGTRRTINRDFVQRNGIPVPPALAVIPLRDSRFNGEPFPLLELGGASLLELKVRALLGSNHVRQVVVTSEEKAFAEHIAAVFRDEPRVAFVQRSEKAARYNASLRQTILEVLANPRVQQCDAQTVMIAAIECPFVAPDVFDDALHTLEIFKADSLISVRADNSLIYQHHGAGMVPILGQEKFTRLEREALYKAAGGITVSRLGDLLRGEPILHGKVGHIVVDKRTACAITDAFDWQVAQTLAMEGPWQSVQPGQAPSLHRAQIQQALS